MMGFKQCVVRTFLAMLLLVVPVAASAQSFTSDRQALLLELISLLEAQLELLQAQLAEQTSERTIDYPIDRAVFFDDDTFLDDIDAEIIARYRVNDMTIDSPSRNHIQYINRMEDLLPEKYHPYFAEFVVFESRQDLVDAFVETTLPYENQWRYGLNEEVFTDLVSSQPNSELMIHEFAHLFSLHEVFTTTRPARCHEFFEQSGCVSDDTIYGKFLTSFWTDSLLDEATGIRESRNQARKIDNFYRRHKDSFVTNYAASSPAEDFAESFAHFVLYDDESFGSIADQKVQFFNRFSATRSMKEEILLDL